MFRSMCVIWGDIIYFICISLVYSGIKVKQEKSFDVTRVKIYENIRLQCINMEFYVVVSSYKQIILSLFPVENKQLYTW